MTLSTAETELLTRLAANGKPLFIIAEAQELWEGSTPIKAVQHRLEKKDGCRGWNAAFIC